MSKRRLSYVDNLSKIAAKRENNYGLALRTLSLTYFVHDSIHPTHNTMPV